jgi:acetyl esterase/lipase
MLFICEMQLSKYRFALLALLAIATTSFAGEPITTIPLWPGTPPGPKGEASQEHDTTTAKENMVAGKRVIRTGFVSKPSIAVYRPSPSLDIGAAVMVCPGGGYRILAMDLEGTEVCDWLNSIGVTGILLKYRVPPAPDDKAHIGPLDDAQRAMGIVRQHAAEWKIDPKRVGVLGFSAGGHLAAALSNNNEKRSYEPIDSADTQSCRPDFAVLIYPGLIVSKGSDSLGPEIKITSSTPPTCIAMASDDPIGVENALVYAMALRKAKVPMDLHIYTKGGHGYGMRPQKNLPVTTWPDRVADWMRAGNWLKPAAAN